MRNRIKASQDSKRKVLSSIGEDMRDLYLLRFLLAMTHTQKSNTTGFIAATQPSIDWRISGATSLVKDCWMYSTTEGIAMKTQQIIAYDTTDDACNGVDLITILNCAMHAGCIDSIACINSGADYPETSSRS